MKQYPKTIPELASLKAQRLPQSICFYRETDTGYQTVNYQTYYEHIHTAAYLLSNHKLSKGDCVGVLASLCYEWEVADKAIAFLGCITVGLDSKASREDLAHILASAPLKGLFVENEQYLELVPEEFLNELEFIYFFKPGRQKLDRPKMQHLWDALERMPKPNDVIESKALADDTAVRIFTSGTTGTPKGIPLTHAQLTGGLAFWEKTFETMLKEGLSTIAWAPLHNGTGRMLSTINFYLGVSQYFVSDPHLLFEKIKIIEPDYLLVVPRILEKVYKKILDKLGEQPLYKRLYVQFFLSCRSLCRFPWLIALTEVLFVKKLRKAVWGSRLQFLICGSAPIDTDILHFFDGIGIPTREVYGQSECGVAITMNRPGAERYGSVGQPIDGVTIRLAQDQEVLVKTNAALSNYWKSDEETSSLYTEDGYLRTGDLGELRDGYLYLTGRKKELIKTSTGQRIAPTQVEQAYSDVAGVEQLVVVGDGRKFLSALISLDKEFECSLKSQGKDPAAYIGQELEKRHPRLARNRQIKRFAIVEKPFSIVSGELTPTLKLRRRVIEDRHSSCIDKLYSEEESPTQS